MSNLTKEAERVVVPLINALLATTDNMSLQAIQATANRILKDVHGTGRTVALTTITKQAVELFHYDMSSDGKWLNFNIFTAPSLLEEIKQAAPERQARWRHFFTTRSDELVREGAAKERPVVVVEKLSQAATYQVQLMRTEDGMKVAGVICLYGSSLNSWFDKAGVEVSAYDLSRVPSTHYMANKEEFAVFVQYPEV